MRLIETPDIRVNGILKHEVINGINIKDVELGCFNTEFDQNLQYS